MGKGETNESLLSVPRTPAVSGSGDVHGVQGVGGYSIAVFGLASDGTPEPTATPSATPEPVVVVPVGTVEPTCEWECILRRTGWPEWVIPQALSVSWCESGHRDVQNEGGGNFWGRFQVSPFWHRDKLIARGYPPTGEVLLSPWVNAEIALMIWQSTGWSEWQCKPF